MAISRLSLVILGVCALLGSRPALCQNRTAPVQAGQPPGHRCAAGPMTRQEVGRAARTERGRALRRIRRTGEKLGGIKIKSDLRTLTAHPTGRDPTRPGYNRIARWVAGRLQEQGVLPAGDGRRGLSRYLQRFSWDQRFTAGRATSDNVVGIRRGDGSSDEAVVVVGHLDGLSAAEKRWYEDRRRPPSMAGYQGANDNASAVASVLYISDALGRLERLRGRPLRRDVIFLVPSAEEEGLKGTEAFARFARQFSGKHIVGVVNFEMVGRGDPAQIRLFGGQSGLEAGNNPLYQRALGLRTRGSMARLIPGHANDGGQRWFTRSDHYVFAKSGVPSVMYLGEPGSYHTPADNLASLDPKTNRAVARHALRLVAELANDPRPLAGQGRSMPLPAVDTGYSGNVFPGP
jgi:hypothetical protein